jgi:hypothetical protein
MCAAWRPRAIPGIFSALRQFPFYFPLLFNVSQRLIPFHNSFDAFPQIYDFPRKSLVKTIVAADKSAIGLLDVSRDGTVSVCMFAFTYACACVHMCMCACVRVLMCQKEHKFTHTYTHAGKRMVTISKMGPAHLGYWDLTAGMLLVQCVCVCVCMCVCVYVRTHLPVYVHKQAHT